MDSFEATLNDVKKRANKRKADDDAVIANLMSGLAFNIISGQQSILESIDSLNYDAHVACTNLSNLINEFQMISNSKFVENRVVDDTSDIGSIKSSQSADAPIQDNISKVKQAIERSLRFVDDCNLQSFDLFKVGRNSELSDDITLPSFTDSRPSCPQVASEPYPPQEFSQSLQASAPAPPLPPPPPPPLPVFSPPSSTQPPPKPEMAPSLSASQVPSSLRPVQVLPTPTKPSLSPPLHGPHDQPLPPPSVPLASSKLQSTALPSRSSGSTLTPPPPILSNLSEPLPSSDASDSSDTQDSPSSPPLFPPASSKAPTNLDSSAFSDLSSPQYLSGSTKPTSSPIRIAPTELISSPLVPPDSSKSVTTTAQSAPQNQASSPTSFASSSPIAPSSSPPAVKSLFSPTPQEKSPLTTSLPLPLPRNFSATKNVRNATQASRKDLGSLFEDSSDSSDDDFDLFLRKKQ